LRPFVFLFASFALKGLDFRALDFRASEFRTPRPLQ
jgi:hypothetical protein